ncbi:hypothetical protein L3X38_013121 [Prunus dulcis]|uniref:Uncharacterized protein n=1 Tax=Prunus dulcis TaxID=3755 RepID=A0AAD4WMA3_PRUDU|nr:hypothetical protein L3X38_013121 [Prunus dulcis]
MAMNHFDHVGIINGHRSNIIVVNFINNHYNHQHSLINFPAAASTTCRGGRTKGQEGSIDPLACRRLLWRSQENSCRPLGQQLVDPLDALNVLDENPQRQRERLVDGLPRW